MAAAALTTLTLALLALTAAASSRTLAEADYTAMKQSAGAVTSESADGYPASVPPECGPYIAQHLVKGCKIYTAPRDETLYTIAKDFGITASLLQIINPQIADEKLAVLKGWQVNLPA